MELRIRVGVDVYSSWCWGERRVRVKAELYELFQ